MKPNADSHHKSVTLYCFTPLASLATFIIELVFSLYILFSYKMNSFRKLAISMLIFLGLFQLSEYLICKTGYAELFTKIGFLAITMLPALGFNMVSLVTKKTIWTKIGYILAAISSFVIIFVPVFISTTCPGKFVVFTNYTIFNNLYGVYYYGYLALGVVTLIYYILKKTESNILLAWMLAGYGSFIVPTIVLFTIESITHSGIASIMCGFAILFAIIIVTKILPLEKSLGAKK